jgi:stage III sporulation protein AA
VEQDEEEEDSQTFSLLGERKELLNQELYLSFSPEHSAQRRLTRSEQDVVRAPNLSIAPYSQDAEFHAMLNCLPEGLGLHEYFEREEKAGKPGSSELMELVMDQGRKPALWNIRDECMFAQQELSAEQLTECVDKLLAHGKQFTEDNRVGINKTLHRISAIKNRLNVVVGLTYRVGRHIPGVSFLIEDLLHMVASAKPSATGELQRPKSILLLGPPAVGKTTLLRDCAHYLSTEIKKRVIIIDTSNEIAGDGDVPHSCIGAARRMQVAKRSEQFSTMIQAVQNHSPHIVVIDEIGTTQEVKSARTISQRGISLVATAHGLELTSLLKDPVLSSLVGGVHAVTLGDKAAAEEAKKGRRGRQTSGKTKLERKGAPTFDIVVDLLGKSQWRVYADVAHTVDCILANEPFEVEHRWLDVDPQTGVAVLKCRVERKNSRQTDVRFIHPSNPPATTTTASMDTAE